MIGKSAKSNCPHCSLLLSYSYLLIVLEDLHRHNEALRYIKSLNFEAVCYVIVMTWMI